MLGTLILGSNTFTETSNDILMAPYDFELGFQTMRVKACLLNMIGVSDIKEELPYDVPKEK
jgi:hypothetical protein